MINVSEQLKKESQKNHNYYVTANATLADGTRLQLEKEDFWLDGNSIIDAIDSSDFPIGVAIEKTATLSLVNDTGKFTAYNFNRAEFAIYVNLQLSDKLETFRRGSFIVCRKPSIDGMINLTLLDYMSKADREYRTNLKFPCTAGEVLRDACQQTGLVLGDSEFKNDDFQVNNAPENTTFRAVIGMVAAIAGANARIDENDLLRIVSFDKGANVISIREALWFDANGQTILDANEEEIITAYEETTSGNSLTALDDIETDIDAIVVTGVKYINDDEECLYGSEGYVIDVSDNQLLKENAREGVKRIGEILKGFELLPFSLNSYAVGYMTFGDHVQFKDSTGKKYDSYLTDIELDFAEGTEFACKAKGLEEQGMEYPSGMKALVKQLIDKEEQKISAYAAKLKQMNDMAANTLGFYYTEVLQPDGSMIAYRHNKLKLAESKIVYKTTAEGFFVTSDYQGTDEATTAAEKWTSGFDSNGDAVLNILYAIGIKAKWIDTRGLTAKDNDGNITFRVNADTGEVEINGNSVYIGSQSIEDMLKNLDNAIAESKNMTMQLSNEYQAITSDADGNISGDFPSVQTSVTVMYGSSDISSDCTYTVSTSSAISGSWDKSSRTYTVSGLSADDGWVDIKATYLQKLSITRRFIITKQKAGEKGDPGTPGRTYILEASCNILKCSSSNAMSPSAIEFTAYYRDGDSSARTPYSGRFVIEETADGTTWTTVYTSSADEDSVRHYLYTVLIDGSGQAITDGKGTTIAIPRDITNIRCRLYAPDGTTLMDMQSVPVVIDAEALTQEQIVNILSNNGEFKGLYYLNGHLYISFDAIMGSSAVLGGVKNGNGYLKIKNDKGNIKGMVDYSGYTVFTSYEENSERMSYTGVQFSDDGIRPVSATKVFTTGVDEVEVSFFSWGINWDVENEELNVYATEVSTDNLIVSKNASFTNSPKIENMSYTTADYSVCWDGRDGYKQLMLRSSSSKRYKDIGSNITDSEIENWYCITPIWAKYKDGYLIEGDENEGRYLPMFLAEDVEKHFPEAARHENGLVEDWNERIMIPGMFAMLKQQKSQIDEMKQELDEIKQIIEKE